MFVRICCPIRLGRKPYILSALSFRTHLAFVRTKQALVQIWLHVCIRVLPKQMPWCDTQRNLSKKLLPTCLCVRYQEHRVDGSGTNRLAGWRNRHIRGVRLNCTAMDCLCHVKQVQAMRQLYVSNEERNELWLVITCNLGVCFSMCQSIHTTIIYACSCKLATHTQTHTTGSEPSWSRRVQWLEGIRKAWQLWKSGHSSLLASQVIPSEGVRQ